MCSYKIMFLTHSGLLAPYRDIDLGQHWLRYWLVAWRHQAITWTSVDLSSVRSCSIYLRAISQEIIKIAALDMHLKITNKKIEPHLSWANQLMIFMKPLDKLKIQW